MINSDLDSILKDYKVFRDANYEVITKLNQMKKEIRFLKQFGENSSYQIIDLLYQSEEDIPDIAEVLGISEYEVYFLMTERQGE